jgi:hypothetical protein
MVGIKRRAKITKEFNNIFFIGDPTKQKLRKKNPSRIVIILLGEIVSF